MLLILAPDPTTAQETSVFDRITGFFSDRFSSSESEVPKARSLEACTALSEDAHELMIQRQEGEARSAATKRALEMAGKAAWPSKLKPTPNRPTCSWSVRPTPPTAVGFSSCEAASLMNFGTIRLRNVSANSSKALQTYQRLAAFWRSS